MNSEESSEEKSSKEFNIQIKSRKKSKSQEEMKNENSFNSSEIDNSGSVMLSKEEDIFNLKKEEKANLIESFKKYIARKFSSKSSIKTDSLDEKFKEEQLANGEKKKSLTKSLLTNQDSIDSYKNILENYKDLLPDDFVLRKFPYSSCSNTFESNGEIEDEPSSTNKKTPDCISLPSTSVSASSSTSQVNQKAQPCSEKPNDSSDSKNCPQKSDPDKDDLDNSSNRRFYHVFKKNELDNLVRENCPDLIIYDSYYDHGNWCICAQKFT